MQQITPMLFIGDAGDAQHSRILKENEIDTVVNVSSSSFDSTDYWVPMRDGPEDLEKIEAAVWTVNKAIERGERVFLHCAVGASRSVVIGALALVHQHDIPYREAIDWIKQERPIAEPVRDLEDRAMVYLRHKHLGHHAR